MRNRSTRQRYTRLLTTLTAAAALAAAGLASAPGDSDVTEVPATVPVAATDDAVNYVVAISVDGLKSSTVRNLGPQGLPAIHRMMREGASTLNARNLLERTITLPNHTSMVTGRRVDAKAGGHGVTFNEDNGTGVHRHAGEYVASMFDVAHDRGLKTAFYSSKDKFRVLNRSWNATNGAKGPHGRDKIDLYSEDSEQKNTTRLIDDLRTSPDALNFLHLAYPDATGHDHGWTSAKYREAVKASDRQVGRVLAAISNDPHLRAHTNVILTADHGGTGHGHGTVTDRLNYTIPFMVWGTGVRKGANLYRINPHTRLNPGTGRPDYKGIQPIRNGEVANLALDLLDLPAVPGSLFNKNRDLITR